MLALMYALCLFELLPEEFRNADLRVKVAERLNQDPSDYSPGKMTYDLRRLRLHGLIERRPHFNRYLVTQDGIRITLFFTRADPHFFRVALALEQPLISGQAPRVLIQDSQAIDRLIQKAKLTN